MAWKTKSSKEVYRNKWLWITEDEVETDFGDNLTYSIVHKKPFALIIPRNGEKFTLVGQYRYAIQKFSWEFPQGHFEHSSILETAREELKEETGLSAKIINLIGTFWLGPGHHSQECKVFLAEDFEKVRRHLGKGERGMRVKEVSSNDLEEMIKHHTMEDGPSLAAWSIFKNYINENDDYKK